MFSIVEEMEKKSAEQGFEAAEIRATLKSLDRERDDLQQQVDEKTEEIMNLEAKKIQSVCFVPVIWDGFCLFVCFH